MKTEILLKHTSFITLAILVLVGTINSTGCDAPKEDVAQPAQKNIFQEKTQDIGEFDPNGNDEVADLQVKQSVIPQMSAMAAGYAISEISKQHITRARQFFHAIEGRYPKDHAEFMEKVIKQNNIQLPVLPGKRRYQYDVENHELVVVEAAKKSK